MSPQRHRRRPWRWLLLAMVGLAHLALIWVLISTTPPGRPYRTDPPMRLSLGPGGPVADARSPQPTAAVVVPAPQTSPIVSAPLLVSAPPPPPALAPPPAPVAPTEAPPAAPIAAILEASALPPISLDSEPAAFPAARAPPLSVARGSAARGSAPSSADPAGDCGLSDQVQQRLKADPGVLGALRRMPRASRSVANAVQLWSGGWTAPDRLGGLDILVPIQAAVMQAIEAAPAACRVAPVSGPRLMIIPDDGATFVLAFGSGVWRWADLRAVGVAVQAPHP